MKSSKIHSKINNFFFFFFYRPDVSKVDPALTLTPELISQVERTEVKKYDIDKMVKTGSDIWSDKWPYTGFST